MQIVETRETTGPNGETFRFKLRNDGDRWQVDCSRKLPDRDGEPPAEFERVWTKGGHQGADGVSVKFDEAEARAELDRNAP